MNELDVLVGLAILVGVVGIVVPLLPGTLLILGAVLVWAVGTGAEAWPWALGAAFLLTAGTVVKYAVPGRRLKSNGVPNRTLVTGGLLAVVGFFVIPVVGLVVGFVAGVYLAESHRLGRQAAWPSTVGALKAVGLSILIELGAAMLAASVWLAGAAST